MRLHVVLVRAILRMTSQNRCPARHDRPRRAMSRRTQAVRCSVAWKLRTEDVAQGRHAPATRTIRAKPLSPITTEIPVYRASHHKYVQLVITSTFAPPACARAWELLLWHKSVRGPKVWRLRANASHSVRYCAPSVIVKLCIASLCIATHILLPGYATVDINKIAVRHAGHLEQRWGARSVLHYLDIAQLPFRWEYAGNEP